jgi:hypothetical protein
MNKVAISFSIRSLFDGVTNGCIPDEAMVHVSVGVGRAIAQAVSR